MKKVIWLIEDESVTLDFMADAADRLGFKAICCSSVGEALRLLVNANQGCSYPHCVISDFQLKDATSEDLLLRIKERFPFTPVICVSGGIPAEPEERLMSKGIITRHKPCDLRALFKDIERYGSANLPTPVRQ